MRRVRTLVLAALCCALPGPANAELTNREEFEKYILEGVNHYKAGQSNPESYKAAIASFEKARALNDIPDVTYNIGRAYHMLGDCEQALVFYRAFAVTSTENGEKVKDYIEEMTKQCNGRTAKIKIACVPADASISIDGAPPIPCTGTHDLKLGERSIVAMAEQYTPEQRTVTLSADDKTPQNIVIELRRPAFEGLFPSSSEPSASSGEPAQAAPSPKSRVSEPEPSGSGRPLGIMFWSGVASAGVGAILSITGTAMLATSHRKRTLNVSDVYIEKSTSKFTGGALAAGVGIAASVAGVVLLVLDRTRDAESDSTSALHVSPAFGVAPGSASASLVVTF